MCEVDLKENKYVLKELTVEFIRNEVAFQININIDKLLTKDKHSEYTECRQIGMYLCRKHVKVEIKRGIRKVKIKVPFRQIGEKYNRSHGDVMHMIKTCNNQMETNPRFLKKVNDIERKILLKL